MITLALLGNPNVGKTTLFNSLTGSKQYVGNWAGVTVEKKEGYLEKDIKIIDLPGIYAMDTFSNEEKVSKNFLESGQADAIINIIDASNLSRNLYLTTQLKKFNIPIILVLNMMDICEANGLIINIKELEKNLGVKVIPISASKGHGLDELINVIKDKDFTAYKSINNFDFTTEEDTYEFIDNLISKSTKKAENQSTSRGLKNLDNIFLNKYLAYPIFLGFMFLIFKLTFSWIGQPLSDILDAIISDKLSPFIESLLSGSSSWFSSLIIDGVIGGVGGVLVFLPLIFTLFLCISFLEDSGYMARIAFLMDKIMRKLGLSGKAFIPLIIGFGCSVPAVMSARTLESDKDRKIAALIAPLMSCNARLPVYILFSSIFFPNNTDTVVVSLYILGIILAILVGLVFKNTLFKKDEEPFIIELPEYRVPQIKSILTLTWDKGKDFLKKAGTLILSMSIVIWFLSHLSMSGYTENPSDSILAYIGSIIAPIFKPLGFGNWQSAVSLMTGLIAKESVVSTMEVIFAGSASLPLYFTQISAYAFMVFVLIYTPCIAVIATIKKEFGSKMMYLSIFYQLTLAWIISFLVFNVGNIILNIL